MSTTTADRSNPIIRLSKEGEWSWSIGPDGIENKWRPLKEWAALLYYTAPELRAALRSAPGHWEVKTKME